MSGLDPHASLHAHSRAAYAAVHAHAGRPTRPRPPSPPSTRSRDRLAAGLRRVADRLDS